MVADVFAEAGVSTVVVDEPAEAAAALRDGASSGGEVSTFTVNALRWSMREARYAELRDRFAVDVSATDLDAVDAFVRSGGGMLALHTAVICFDGAPVWKELCGAAWNWDASSHPPAGPVAVTVTDAGRTHPVTAGVDDFVVDDELYGDLDLVDGIVPLLEGTQGGATYPVLWAREVGVGRVVTDLLGHGPESIAHPVHRAVLGRAAAWIGGGAPGPSSERGRP
jgi:hypothetical protein